MEDSTLPQEPSPGQGADAEAWRFCHRVEPLFSQKFNIVVVHHHHPPPAIRVGSPSLAPALDANHNDKPNSGERAGVRGAPLSQPRIHTERRGQRENSARTFVVRPLENQSKFLGFVLGLRPCSSVSIRGLWALPFSGTMEFR